MTTTPPTHTARELAAALIAAWSAQHPAGMRPGDRRELLANGEDRSEIMDAAIGMLLRQAHDLEANDLEQLRLSIEARAELDILCALAAREEALEVVAQVVRQRRK